MVDTPTLRNRFRKQELGTNTNTWGDDKLNEVFDAIDQAIDGVEAIALAGDTVLSTSNYTTTDQSLNRVLKFTGTLSDPAVVTLPSVQHWYLIVNSAGAGVTVKTAAGAGVETPNGATALVYCDGADVLNGAPTVVGGDTHIAGALSVTGKISGVVAGTAATDAVNKTQMETAIAVAGTPGSPGTVKVDASAASVYLGTALTAGTGIGITDNGDSLEIDAAAVDAAASAAQVAADTAQSAATTAQASADATLPLVEAALSLAMSN